MVNKLAVGRGPSHVTTGTMVNPALADKTLLPYLDVTQRYVHLNGFNARQLILFKIRIHVRNNMRY